MTEGATNLTPEQRAEQADDTCEKNLHRPVMCRECAAQQIREAVEAERLSEARMSRDRTLVERELRAQLTQFEHARDYWVSERERLNAQLAEAKAECQTRGEELTRLSGLVQQQHATLARYKRVAVAARRHRVQEDDDANCTAFDESIAELDSALAECREPADDK